MAQWLNGSMVEWASQKGVVVVLIDECVVALLRMRGSFDVFRHSLIVVEGISLFFFVYDASRLRAFVSTAEFLACRTSRQIIVYESKWVK